MDQRYHIIHMGTNIGEINLIIHIMYNISYDDSNLALFCGKHINPNQSINNLPALLPSLSGSFSLVLLPVASPPVLTIFTSPLWTLLTHAPLSLPFTHTMFLVDGHCTTPLITPPPHHPPHSLSSSSSLILLPLASLLIPPLRTLLTHTMFFVDGHRGFSSHK